MARIVPKSQIEVPKLVVKDVTSSKNEHLVIKANKPDDDLHVKVDDLLQVDKIEPLHNDFVQIDNLKVKKIDYTENQDDAEFENLKVKNEIKLGENDDHTNKISIYNDCLQIIGGDDDSNKVNIGYYIENDKEKAFIPRIALSTKTGDIQCNKLISNEIQASNLHTHSNKSYLDSINQNLSKSDWPTFERLLVQDRLYLNRYYSDIIGANNGK